MYAPIKYCIVRFYDKSNSKVIRRGLTLEEAEVFCNKPTNQLRLRIGKGFPYFGWSHLIRVDVDMPAKSR